MNEARSNGEYEHPAEATVVGLMDALAQSVEAAKRDRYPWNYVERDQCNGASMACVNCQAKLGERHNVMCWARRKAYQEANRGA